jgi:hypothetical protein
MRSGSTKASLLQPVPEAAGQFLPEPCGVEVADESVCLEPHAAGPITFDERDCASSSPVLEEGRRVVEDNEVHLIGAERRHRGVQQAHTRRESLGGIEVGVEPDGDVDVGERTGTSGRMGPNQVSGDDRLDVERRSQTIERFGVELN